MADIAEAEQINAEYVSRVRRLTLLAPPIAEAILEGKQPEWLSLNAALDGFRVDWSEQQSQFALM